MQNNDTLELLSTIIESISDGIYITNDYGNYVISNKRFSDMFRIPNILIPSEKAQQILELIADQIEDSVSFLNRIDKYRKKPIAEIFTMKFIDGRIYDCYTAPISKDTTKNGRVWTFEDVTKLKKTEETAMLYLDLMSHDIRNRLQGIVMSVEILNLMVEDPDSVSSIHDIENDVRRCANLISKIKDAESIDDAPIAPRSLTDAIGASIKSIEARFSRIDIECEIEEQQAIMNADRFLETLFVNLLENAIQHNPKEEKKVWVNLKREGVGFEISISDNGPGIDDQRKKDLFDKNRRYGGVSLHVATQIAGKYGGNLRVFDRVSGDHAQGAEFRLWIPEPIVRCG